MKLQGVPEKVLGQFFIVNNASVVYKATLRIFGISLRLKLG